MENTTQALYIAFAVFVFILALSLALFLVDKLNITAKTLVWSLDEKAYYDSLELTDIISGNEENTNNASRIVGIDTIIPSLYRYYKESFAVRILDESGNLLQYFDTTTEGNVMQAKTMDPGQLTSQQKALLSLYDAPNPANPKHPCYMFGAPWLGSINKDAKTRVDMYISGSSGYINNTWVNYGLDYNGLKITAKDGTQSNKIYLNNFKNRKFKEIFSQYAYEGDTITDEFDELVSLTGNKQISTKIVITYQLIP